MITKHIKAAALLVTAFFFLAIFDACKKNDLREPNTEAIQQSHNALFERAKKATIERNEPISTIMPVNQKSYDIYFSDGNNKRIDITSLFQNLEASRVSVCDFQFDGNGDPIEDMFPSNYYLNSTGFIFDCVGGGGSPTNYRVSFDWSLAVHHSILAQNTYGAGGGTLRSRFTLKIKNSGGTIIATYSNNFILGQDIHDLGDWSVDPTRTLYQINASINVPTSIFTNGVTYETTITLATDCSYTPQLAATQTTTSVNSLNTQPCKRTDKVWTNPGSGPAGELTAIGTFSICTPPSGYTVSTNHELEFRLKNNGSSDSWESQTSTVLPGNSSSGTQSPTFGTYTGYVYLPGTTSGSGTWLVRYRNSNSCSPSAPWIVEKWVL